MDITFKSKLKKAIDLRNWKKPFKASKIYKAEEISSSNKESKTYLIGFIELVKTRPRLRTHLILFTALVIFPLILLGSFYLLTKPNYHLSAAAEKLIGTADVSTMKGFNYSSKDKAFYLNKSAIHSSNAQGSDKVGSSPKQPTYSLELPSSINKGISYYDDQSGLSFNLTPQFKAAKGKLVDNHVVYPINHNEQAVYTVKTDGLKEDIVINHKVGNSLSFSYKLNLPSNVIARQLPTGAIGIYSANPVLFGNISYGSSADQASVEKARQNSPKNYLVFALTTPTIFESGVTSNPPGTQTNLSLKGNVLTVMASNLAQAHYPLTIDPSVLVSSISTFGAGNNEGGIGCVTSNNICEIGLTGGSLHSNWNTSGSTAGSSYALSSSRQNATAVAYNGFLYSIGGNAVVYTFTLSPSASASNGATYTNNGATFTVVGAISGSTTLVATGTGAPAASGTLTYASGSPSGNLSFTSVSNSTTATSLVEYTAISSSDGSLSMPVSCASPPTSGVWCTTTTLPAAGANVAAVVYDDQLYVEDNFSGGQSLYFTSIDVTGSGGGLGSSWTSDTTDVTNAVTGASMVAYNGYLYVVGGVLPGSCTYENTVQYALINGDGNTASPWSTSTFSTGRAFAAAATYNGFLYLWGGSSSSLCPATDNVTTTYNDVQYVPLSSGIPGTWTTSSVILPNSTFGMGYGVYAGYLYTVGGAHWVNGTPASAAVYNNVYFALINAGGSVGSWTSTNTISAAICSPGSAIYNGYFYTLGGTTDNACSTLAPNVQYNKIDATGETGNFTQDTNTAFVNGRFGAGLAAVNGYLFVMGGTSASGGCTSSICNTVYSTKISSDGTLGNNWAVQASNLPGALTNFAVATYNDYIYAVGGCANAFTTSCTAAGTVYSGSVSSAGVLTWQAAGANRAFTTDTASARYDLGAYAITGSANNGYLYIVGGYSGASSPLHDMWYIQLVASTGLTTSTWIQVSSSDDLSSTAGARGAFGYAVYGDYAYIAGGVTTSSSGNCTTGSNPYYCNDIWYIQLNPAGGVSGAWTSSTTFTSARERPSLYIWDSYLYLSGGDAGSSTYYNDVQFAPIAAGVPQTMSTANSNSGPSVRTGQAAVAYDGTVYIVGGLVSASSSPYCTAGSGSSWYCTDSYYAPINTGGPGTVGGSGWTTVPNGDYLPNPIWGASTVAVNGYLYVVGGEEPAGGNITENGTGGSCLGGQTTKPVPTNVYILNITAKGGSAASNASGYQAPGNGGGGGATVTASFSVTPGDTLELYQGCESGFSNTDAGYEGFGCVPNNGNGVGGFGATQLLDGGNNNGAGGNGTPGSGSPPSAIGGNGGCSVHAWYGGGAGGGFLAGGGGGGGTSTSNPGGVSATQGASSAKVMDTNINTVDPLIQAGGGGGTGVGTATNPSGDGGNAGCATVTNTVTNGGGGEACQGGVGADGQNGAYSASGTGRGGGGGAGSSYCMAAAAINSECNSPTPWKVSGTANTGGDGSLSITYTPVEPYVKYTTLNSDGSLGGAFNSDTHKFIMTGNGAGEWGVSATAYDNTLFISGGSDTINDHADVQYASIPGPGGTGALTSNWAQDTSTMFAPAREFANLVAYNGYLYVIGGRNNSASSGDCTTAGASTNFYCTGVYVAPITSGVPGAFSQDSSHSLPAGRALAGATIYDGYVYVAGGCGGLTCPGANNLNSVLYAQLPTNGGGGGDLTSNWTNTSGFSLSRYGTTLAAYDGYLYLTGGNTGSDSADTQYAPINPDGSIGNWSTAPTSFSPGREEASSVIYNGYLYVMGGDEGVSNTACKSSGASASPLCDDVQYGNLNVVPRSGLYTYRVDNSADTNPIGIINNGSYTGNLGTATTSGPGGVLFSYQFATKNCTTWNTNTQLPNTPANFINVLVKPLTFTANGCSAIPTNVGEYTLFSYTLDDSLTATFPDNTCSNTWWWSCGSTTGISNHTTVTNFDYFYHPNVGNRLRGGGTFAGGSLQSLDAPP